MQIRFKNDTYTLTKNDYIGGGGEGSVYRKDKLAFKIYNQGKLIIPQKKIDELSAITNDNVLAPIARIYKSNTAIGYAMKYIPKTEYLCKLFNRGFRERNKITQKDITTLVKFLQTTLSDIHKCGILVVDFNEMNFLYKKISGEYTPIFIDVDSYQTQSFPATALMESIRDRHTRGFNEGSDWFSFAVVAFELYIGVHPYKGKHPDYSPKDWAQRMIDNVSVFNPKVSLPASCQDLSVIPKSQMEWFKAVFEKKERSVPPLPGVVPHITPDVVVTVESSAKYNIDTDMICQETIDDAAYFDGKLYSVTKDGVVYVSGCPTHTAKISGSNFRFCCVEGGSYPILIYEAGDDLCFYDFSAQKTIDKSRFERWFVSGHNLYIIDNRLLEIVFKNVGGKILKFVKNNFQFSSVYRVGRNAVVQDIVGHCFLWMNNGGMARNYQIEQLYQCKILDVFASQNQALVLYEKGGRYYKSLINTQLGKDDKNFFTVLDDDASPGDGTGFLVLNKGLTVLPLREKVEMRAFLKGQYKINIIDGNPIPSHAQMVSDGDNVCFYFGNRFMRVGVAK